MDAQERRALVALTLTALGWALLACTQEPGARREVAPTVAVAAAGPIQPLTPRNDLSAAAVELGRRLFFDGRLSRDGAVSCASCHPIERYGVDHRRVSVGVGGLEGSVNAPTVLNSGLNFRQFWDGRAADLEEQAGGPITNPVEMGSTWPEVIARLSADPALGALSERAYARPIDEQVVRSALATFQRSLLTLDAPFDRFLRGEAALGSEALDGWRLFRELGCVACHQGNNIGGNMYATFGVMGDYFEDRPIQAADLGLFARSRREDDRHKFKVPSLRNVAETAPYFHDGKKESLGEAVEVMGRTQLGVELEPTDRDHLVAFLSSLTGRLPEVAR